MKPRAIVPFVAILWAAGTACAAEQLLLTGNEKAIWLVRADTDQKTYDVLAKPTDQTNWRWIAKQIVGTPTAATALDDQLHVLFHQPQSYLAYPLGKGDRKDSRTIPHTPQRLCDDPRWPSGADRLAICPAAGLSGAKTNEATILAVVPRPAVATSEPTSQATQPTGEASLVQLGVFVSESQQWRHLCDYATPISLAPKGPLLSACVAGRVYLAAAQADGSADLLSEFSDGQWRDIPLTGAPPRSRITALLGWGDRLVVVLASPVGSDADGKGWQLHLGFYEPQKEMLSLQPVIIEGQAQRWDSVASPLTARLADRLTLLWRQDEQLHWAACDLSGEMSKPTELTFEKPPDTGGKEIMRIFTWGLLFALLIPMFFLRPAGPPKPFALPATMHTANLLKRLLAGLLDFLPFTALTTAIYRLEPIPFNEILQRITEGSFPTSYIYAIVTTFLLHAAYGIVMELRYGATLGKMLFKLRVVGDGGAPADLRGVLLRNLVRIIEMSWLLFPLMLLLPVFTRNRQRLGDLMARTAVIDAAFAPPPTPPDQDPHKNQTEPPQSNDPPKGTS